MTRQAGWWLVRSGAFCVTAEVVPPRSASGDPVRAQARGANRLRGCRQRDRQPAPPRTLSPVAGAAIVAAAGLEPTMQITCRDRNRLGLTADLLGGWALGAEPLLPDRRPGARR